VHDGTAEGDRVDWFGPEPMRIALHAQSLSFDWRGERYEFQGGRPWWQTDRPMSNG
jgi:hypothetical protein